VQGDALDDPVALVEDSEHRDPLAHRRHARLVDARRGCGIGDHRLRRILLVVAAIARHERERQQREGDAGPHAYSGIHGW
jgi:hypothetical protein